jgi:hypothetical protein
MRVQTVKRALASPKTDANSRDVTSVINPAIDMLRAIHAQTELAQRCFGDLKFTDAEPGGSTENLTDEVTEGVARLVSLPPGTATEDPADLKCREYVGTTALPELSPTRQSQPLLSRCV